MTGVASYIVASLIVFLVCRVLILWYWKIDRIVGLLEEIESHLRPRS